MYDDVRTSDRPRELVLEFFESAYKAGATTAGWPTDELQIKPL
jgi:hypothetical protein